jgi:hypothetical protein
MENREPDVDAQKQFDRFNSIATARWTKLENNFPVVAREMRGSSYWLEFNGAIAYTIASAKCHIDQTA